MKLQANEATLGFTLVELIIYIALASAVIVSLILWVLNLSGVRDKNYVMVEVEANRQFIASTIIREIKQANAVITPVVGETNAALELDRPGLLPNVIFRMSAGTLYLEVVGNLPIAISSHQVEIINLEFQNLTDAGDNRESVWAYFTLGYRNSSSNEFTYAKETTFVASNRL